MFFPPIIKGITVLCVSSMLSPDAYNSSKEWCFRQQQQYFPGYSYTAMEKAIVQNNREKAAKSSQSTNRWYKSWDTAWKLACDQGKPLVCVFVHQGCPECDRMNATLAKPAAVSSLKSAIKVKLEFSSNPGLVQRWGIKYTPTFLVFSPAHKGEVYREVGALSLDRLRTLQPSIEGLVTQPQKSSKSNRESTHNSPKKHTGSSNA